IHIIMCMATQNAIAQPHKLKNCGNTCFLNASHQALYNITPLTNFLIQQKPTDQTIVGNYITLITQFRNTPQQTFGCSGTLGTLDKQAYELMKSEEEGPVCGSQEDATEFIWKFSEKLHNKYATDKEKENSPIKNFFHFLLISTINCPARTQDKGFSVPKTDDAQNLDLPIQNNSGKNLNSLQECLQNYFAIEKIDEYIIYKKGMKETAANIQEKRADCTKQLKMSKAPEILFISLKRFDNFGQKLHNQISIPEKLDIKNYVNTKGQPTDYELISVIVQGGGAKGGHYWAYVRQPNNIWYRCDDQQVLQVSINDSQHKEQIEGGLQSNASGYLFIYQRKDGWDKTVKAAPVTKPITIETPAASPLALELQSLQKQLSSLETSLQQIEQNTPASEYKPTLEDIYNIGRHQGEKNLPRKYSDVD
ncbi:MAG: ubiquitin carboxyl-terminal hydrolase, partial [Candidatus Babeliales bacterium]